MAATSLQLSLELGICRNHSRNNNNLRSIKNMKTSGQLCFLTNNLPPISLKRYSWSCHFSKRIIHTRVRTVPFREQRFRCRCFSVPGPSLDANTVKNATLTLARSFNQLQASPLVIKLASAASIVIFAIWGLGPLVRQIRNIFLHKSDNNWKKSSTYQVTTSYVQPLLLWTGAIIVCRAIDPMSLPTEAGQIVKQRLLNFVRSLSTVLAFAYCLSSAIQHAQKFFLETKGPVDTRNMGFQFAGKALYTAVWVAAVSLFMELLGFSTQKWLTAGGLGTVLLTLAGREIFTNFLSSAMIHATRPFVVNEWIQTKIEGYDVSGTVEHVGWWSPTIVRGEDREAVHIPNHKFTVNVVRNLTQKTHWRIKTHLGISHLDVSKINSIVADMRKVLAKNPQVEQQKLHRRVFLDNINPENQALMILVSCFVKTSHFEEYLCVKEAIFLDLLRVIRHHGARLATPMRTVQKIFTDADLDNIPFSSEPIFNRGASVNRPVLLIEAKTQTRSPREEDNKATTPTKSSPDNKVDMKPETASSTDSKTTKETQSSDNNSESVQKPKVETKEDSKIAAKPSPDNKATTPTKSSPDNKVDTKAETASSTDSKTTKETQSSDNNSESVQKPKVETKEDSKIAAKPSSDSKLNNSMKPVSKQAATQPPVNKPSLEENLVLGVALDGSKRTLPIEEEMVPPSNGEDVKELAGLLTGNGPAVADKDKNDVKRPNSSGSVAGDPQDQQE